MGIPEVERRVGELSALIKCQLRLIRKLEKRGKDLTSAQIVFDSLRVSLFLATQDLHRARCFGEPDRIQNGVDRTSSAWESKPWLVVVPHGSRMARLTDGDTSMKAKDDLLDLTDKIGMEEIREQFEASIVPGTKVEQESESSERSFGFRPLTEEEKKEFVNSFNDDTKRILDELAGKAKRSGESAA
jgi:hypothetical protein